MASALTLAVPLVLQRLDDRSAWWRIAGCSMAPLPCHDLPAPEAVLAALAAHHQIEAAAGFSPDDLEAIAAEAPAVVDLAVEAVPPAREPGWEAPLPLTVATLRWHRLGVHAAAVPAANVLVHCAAAADCDELLRRRLHALAEREDPGARLRWWLRLAQWTLEAASVAVELPLRRGAAQAHQRILAEVARRAELYAAGPLHGREGVVRRLAAAFAAKPRRLVVVAGPPGCGKSACLAAALARSGRDAWAIDAVRLMVGHRLHPLWSDLLEAVCREAAEDDAILHLGGLFELCETGQAVGLPFTPADLLRPRLARGEFAAAVEATPEELARIQASRPGLLAHAEVVRLEAPAWDEVADIIRAHLPRAQLPDAALARLVELNRRYAPYSPVPARALRLARRLVAAEGAATPEAVEAAFAADTGLPGRLLAQAATWPAEEIHAFLAARVLGQEAAVAAVADAVVLAKARLDRPGRPLAVLLLAGPTGTGKTSLALALAELLFDDRQRLARFDLSEFATPAAAARLVGGAGADEGLLVATIRRQPAGVLLLDEVEKADPAVHDYLLQLAGEGRLADARGRHADAAGTVVLLTSNLGSESLGREALGFAAAGATGDAAWLAAVDAAFRPELVNRFDAVLVFAPLGAGLVRAIAADRLRRLEARPGLQRPPHRIAAEPAALDQFAAAATDPRWGARGVLRAIERHVAVPLARALAGLPAADGRTPPAADPRRPREVAVAAGPDAPLASWRPAAATARPLATAGPTPDAARLARPGWESDADRDLLARAAAALHRHVRAVARAPLLLRLRAQAERERERRRHHGPAHGPPGQLARRLDAFAAIRSASEDADLAATTDLLEALDRDGVPGPAEPAAGAALVAAAAALRAWLADELRRRQAEQAPRGLRLIAFHRAALAAAWPDAARLVASVAPRARWTAWLPQDGGWTRREQAARAPLPAETLGLGVDFAGADAWPLNQALVGDWRLAVPVSGRRQEGLLRIAPWSGDPPPDEALRRGWLPQRSEDERDWAAAAAGVAVEDWLDRALAELVAEDAS